MRARSSRRILDAARALADGGGIEELSMRRLAHEADVSVRTIYNLFGDKDGLVEALVRDSFDAMDVAVGDLDADDPIERIWQAVTISIEMNCRYVPKAVVAAVVTDATLQRELSSYWPGLELTLDAIRTATRSRALRADLAAETLFAHAGAVFLHLLWRWSQGEIDEPTLTAGVLHAFDVSLLAVATPRVRVRLLAHIAALDPQLPHLVPR
ncbi:MAG: TetR/AcrR family transcriptional regulator [Acidimicrobiales bacterium]|nr:TetR/AcrR family transcriptional regulator [Acidimicrobiales bacterium]